MAKELQENFVLHGYVGSTANAVAELRFDHAERRLDQRPLVIELQKIIATELEIGKHLLPERSRFSRHAVDLERDEGCTAKIVNQLQVLPAQIRLIG